MDLGLYFRVIWRFRLLVAAGLLIASLLAFLSVAKVGLSGVTPTVSTRGSETWSSQTTLFITQEGFPWGRTTDAYKPAANRPNAPIVPRFAQPTRFLELTVLYAQLANSDAVDEVMLRDGPLNGSVTAAALTDAIDRPLPLIRVTSFAASPEAAVQTARRATDAFVTFLTERQETAAIPSADRVVAEVVNQPTAATLASGGSKKVPVLVFLTVAMAAVGLAFILENLRPRVRAVAEYPRASSDTRLSA